MSRATTAKLRRISLREDVVRTAPGPLTVDREKGIIFGVAVLGAKSDNGRIYTPEARKKALPLYERRKTYCNHPGKPEATRDVEDALGILVSPRIADDGLMRADWHLVLSHPMAARILEDAEKGLGLYGLSHNADGRGEHRDGVFVVEEITEVRSVDLVTDPATVRNLSESRRTMKTIRQLIEAAAQIKPATRKALLEADGDMLDMPASDTPPTDSTGASMSDPKQLLAQAVAALVQSDDPADHGLAQKIMKLLKPDSGGGSTTDSSTDGGTVEEECDDDAKKDKGMNESRVKALCALAGVEPTKPVLEAVVGLSEGRAVATLTLLKGSQGGGQPQQQTPRSSAPSRPVPESKDTVPAGDDPKKLGAWLRN